MSKLTPMILAVIMLASTSLVALDLAELETKNTIEADGRAGPDAEVVSILSPRATTTDSITGEQLHTLKAGEVVNFETYIQNAGDTAIEEMGISLTVYLSNGGARGMIAKDAAGNDLTWTNGDVVCDDAFVCPWSTLDAGDALDYGKYVMTYQGSAVSWEPITGNYIVVVTTTALGDSDAGNDYSENLVSVVDWTDIIVDLSWSSGKDVEGGDGDKAFDLNVELGGSTAWQARNITLQLEVEGTLSSALGPAGEDLIGTSQYSQFGVSSIVETYRNGEDETNYTNGTRYVIDFEDSATWQGVLTPDTSGTDGDYSVEVSLVSYVLFGEFPECLRTVEEGTIENVTDSRTVQDFCEITQYQDDVSATSEDEITGTIKTYHDIGISDLVVNQGYNVDANGTPLDQPTMPGIEVSPLNPAWSSVQATVRHSGSSLETTYDWKVTFEIENTGTGVTTTEEADDCSFGASEPYMHKELGVNPDDLDAAFETGEACVMYNFEPGVYNITATVSMVDVTDSQGNPIMDMSGRNDESSIYGITALNNRPGVSLTVEQVANSIVVGTGEVTLVADAFDADDETGALLNYIWTHPDMPEVDGLPVPSQCNGIGPEFSICLLTPYSSDWAGVNTYSVTVTDSYGSGATDFLNVFIWNQIEAQDSTDSGIEMIYDLTYDGFNAFEVTVDDSAEGPYSKDLTSYGYAGEYTSVAIVDYTPSTTYLPEDVLSQAITINYDPALLEPTSVFWITNGNWAQLDSSIDAGTISIDMGVGNQVLPQGEIVLMGGELQIIEEPEGNPTGLNVIATKGGDITATWSYDGNTVPGFDWLQMEICDSNDVCSTTQENTTLVGHSMSGQTDTTHGETYTYTLSVCNVGGCHPTVATESATADKEVDGDASASAMTVSNKADSNAWTVSWTPSGDTSDVAGWKVCWTDYSWPTSGEMPSTCSDAGDSTTTDINHPGGTGTKSYYFTAVPYDDKSNMDNAVPGTDIILVHQNSQEDPCEVDPEGADCTVGSTDDDAEGSIPAGAWGAIIGLVVVAFVVGAFILSRGGDGDDGKDWDY